MMYANYTPMIVVWIVIIQTLLSFYHAKTSLVSVDTTTKAKRNLGQSLQFLLFLLLVSKYVELYALTLNHPKTVEAQDWQLLPIIISVYVIIQLIIVAKIPTRIGASLLTLGLVNVGFLSYLALISN